MYRTLAGALVASALVAAGVATPARAQSDPTDAVNQPPTAVVDGPSYGLYGRTVTLTSARSTDPDGHIASRHWTVDFGGTIVGSATGPTVTIVLGSSGVAMQATLQVTDDGVAGTGALAKSASVEHGIALARPDKPNIGVFWPTTSKPGSILITMGNMYNRVIVASSRDATNLCGNGPTPAHTFVSCGNYLRQPLAYATAGPVRLYAKEYQYGNVLVGTGETHFNVSP